MQKPIYRGVHAGALDEMFSQGDPFLAGVDHGYLFGLSLRETRSGEDWAEVLQQGKERGLNLEIAVKDAAKGILFAVVVAPRTRRRAGMDLPWRVAVGRRLAIDHGWGLDWQRPRRRQT